MSRKKKLQNIYLVKPNFSFLVKNLWTPNFKRKTTQFLFTLDLPNINQITWKAFNPNIKVQNSRKKLTKKQTKKLFNIFYRKQTVKILITKNLLTYFKHCKTLLLLISKEFVLLPFIFFWLHLELLHWLSPPPGFPQ